MKRYLVFGAVLAALLIGGTSISWALDFGTSGSYRLRGFYNDNLTDGDKNIKDSAAYYASQFMLTTKATQDGVSGVVTLLAGSQGATGNRLLGDDVNGFTFGPTGTSIEVLEAYIKADFKTWVLTGGRAGLKFGNGVVLDDWVDGIWADLGLGGATLTVGTAKLAESTDNNTVPFIGNAPPGSGTGDDADLYFVNAGLGKTGMASGTNVFLQYLTDRGGVGGIANAAGADDGTLWILGAATDLDLNGIKIKAELDLLDGSLTPTGGGGDIDLKGFNVVLGGKLDAGGIPLGVDLVYTSGQDAASTNEVNINGLSGNYPLGIIVTNSGARSLGVTDGTCLSVNGSGTYGGGSINCAGGSGLTAIKVSSGLTHGPHVVDVAAIWAQASEDPDDTGPGGKDFGIELDATVTWALTKNLSVLGGVGYLLAGDFWESQNGNGASDDPVVLVGQLGYTF